MRKIFWIGMILMLWTIPAAAVAENAITIYFKDGRHMTIPSRDIMRIEFQSSDQAGGHPGYSREISVSGSWKTNNGDIQLWQTGNQVTGAYQPQEHGEINGTLSGNTMSGFWIEDMSNTKCPYAKNGRYYWGKLRFVFDGSRFNGQWGYCDAEPNQSWTGTR
ncbi:MAG: hypothetical protein BWY31_04797 [Lentisphaerae bacterium ADurb.Bin242]|nr:MAG: hypothetical protein BWY31_04797 [Lentisphaerae bacterium ADurb.Bin242]